MKELVRVRDDLTRKTDEQGQTIAVRARVAYRAPTKERLRRTPRAVDTPEHSSARARPWSQPRQRRPGAGSLRIRWCVECVNRRLRFSRRAVRTGRSRRFFSAMSSSPAWISVRLKVLSQRWVTSSRSDIRDPAERAEQPESNTELRPGRQGRAVAGGPGSHESQGDSLARCPPCHEGMVGCRPTLGERFVEGRGGELARDRCIGGKLSEHEHSFCVISLRFFHRAGF